MQVELKPVAWQPIASAPKDGTWFLAFEPDGDCNAHYACQYYGEDCEGGTFWSSSCGQYVTTSPEPTHWMPLPPAPDTTPVDAHPLTTNPVDDRETPVGDQQMVEAVAKAILKAHALDTVGVGLDTVHAIEDQAWHAWIPEAQAALTAARAQVEGEIAEWHGFKAKCLRDLADMNLPAVSPTIARAEARWHDEVRADLAAGEHRKDAP